MDDLPHRLLYLAAYTHFVLGVFLWLVIVLRWHLHLKYPRPVYPSNISLLSKRFAALVQYAMLTLLTIQPIIGVFFFMNHPPELWSGEKTALAIQLYEIHEKIAYILVALICIHIGGYIKHLVFNKINLIRRVW
jgi:cytochrome b561